MVKIAIAGGAGSVAREIIDALVATQKHNILVLTRRDVPASDTASGVTYAKTDYSSTDELVSLFKGTHTVLSFLAAHLGQAEAAAAQKKLIDASISAGVTRFAPSEWFSTKLDHMSWFSWKGETRQYLQEINKDNKVLEYSLFQPGMFTDYLSRPYMTAKHVQSLETPFDFQNRRMLIREGGEGDVLSFTTVKDLASVVTKAVEYEGVWPVIGGIRGSILSIDQLIELGQNIRGAEFDVTRISTEGLEAGDWTSSWVPILHHPTLHPDHVEAVSKVFITGLLLAAKEGAIDTSDEWNKLLPDHESETAEKIWKAAFDGKA
ncbi:uncharacterized protein EKO05_0010884 [Ascochyta rabiei]|uniref:uncharacterized protein n=1 Tax=Didymella rabiei TaxID=5454 RepID=UPI0018FFE719|nr:uncharacterized protein EKO05_0010884 [Ascochyta rabiei]UPX20658.1 hypothetical protein EKO05_0010884 [Ascochyta rabiei]